MDFFQNQERAKSQTTRLIALYILGLLAMTAVVTAVTLGFFFVMAEDMKEKEDIEEMDTTTAAVVLTILCVGSVFALVIGGTLYKTRRLASGSGHAVAESLGGRRVNAGTNDPAERRLYNVVEEMALASGIPIPTLYVMDHERSINAFAAGFSPNAAVIGVHRGTIDLLTRDELQGVIAHEFAHILNGDMRLNMRIMGTLFGLQMLLIAGNYAMFGLDKEKVTEKKGWSGCGCVVLPWACIQVMLLLFVFIPLVVIGSIGEAMSMAFKSALCRQREFLADASAVQFTRNPDGIVGALKKIGSPDIGSNVDHPRAAEASHLFFGNTCGFFSLGEMLATHPDIITRIKRIDPRFDGYFPPIVDTRPKPKIYVHKSKAANFLKHQPTTDSKQSVIEHIGELNIVNVLTARALLDAIPQDVSVSADNPLTAQAVFFAMLLDPDEEVRARQYNQIQFAGSDFLMKESRRLYGQVRSLPEYERIPLAQHVSATLREMTQLQYQKFSRVLDLLISANPGTNLFEYTIKAMLLRDLDIHFGLAKQLRVRHTTLESVRMPVVSVLSYLAHQGHSNRFDSRGAFSAAMQELGLSGEMLLPIENTPFQFDKSLQKLAETSPALKKRIFSAFMTCVWYDGTITPKEAALIRAIAAMLAIPIPMLA